ncbi:MAG: type III-B CRISPR module RAMP protein Cmr1 [Deltaproteobacteria bacterium]|nr:MAG: type III-B CRISPR module RAMP protein Cmr1 [Deltaproteobacteria bacterium]
MARKLTTKEEQDVTPAFTASANSQWQEDYNIKLLTPMAGGGHNSWIPDEKNPVRVQAVKGQLRFWWRAMQSPGLTIQELREAEDAFWGSTSKASPVRLDVILNSKAEYITIPWGGRRGDILQFAKQELPAYVLFPLQNSFTPPQQCKVTKNLSFTLKVQCPDAIKDDVQKTIKLWLLFGGLGARTTRGCGSLYCADVMKEFSSGEEIKTFIKAVSSENGGGVGVANWPNLAGCPLGVEIAPKSNDAKKLWRNYLENYGEFRQGKNYAREPGEGNRPGRSRWPEADAIRNITQEYQNHSPRHKPHWFPRAAYGMPIISRFNRDPQYGDPTDPAGDFQLQPQGKTRWPSPFILKVIKLRDGNLAKIWLLLNHQIPQKIELECKKEKKRKKKYLLGTTEHPDNYTGKQILHKCSTPAAGTAPYDALIDYLKIPEVT